MPSLQAALEAHSYQISHHPKSSFQTFRLFDKLLVQQILWIHNSKIEKAADEGSLARSLFSNENAC